MTFGLTEKMLTSCLTILVVVLILINSYPMLVSRDLVFLSKRTALENQANQLGVALGALDSLTPDTVRSVVGVLNTGGLARITVVNARSDVLYQHISRRAGFSTADATALINGALAGNDMFQSRFTEGVFVSNASVPILSRGRLVGCVFISEYDAEEGGLILGLQQDIRIISVGLTLGTVALLLVFTHPFRRRLKGVLDAIESVREGEYSYRIRVRGHDELAQISEEFNSLTTRLQENEETRRRFVADASHDLKTPLASIQLLSDSILQNSGMDQDTVNEFVSDIRSESERLARTTAQLLALTRLDNSFSVQQERVDCADVTREVLRTLRPIAESKGVELAVSLEEGCTVLAQRDAVYQVVANLAENAVKYSDNGGRVALRLEKAAPHLRLTVTDRGIGIPDEDLPYIFDRFYRVDKSRNRERGGSGLGLSIVKDTVEKLGGTVTARVNTAGGMDFLVTLPLAKE